MNEEFDIKIRIAGIVKESIVDGPGIRLVVFAQGCKHHCPGCHNPETHDFHGGYLTSVSEIIEIAKNNPLLDGITLSGGDPFEQPVGFAMLAEKASSLGLHVMAYTGYTYEEILANNRSGWLNFLEKIDVLVDGLFEIEKMNLMLLFKGSENQRIIDVSNSIKKQQIVLAF